MIPTDLVPLRSLVPGESEELSTDPSLLAGRGGRQPPPSPPAQHSEGQVCDPAIGALVLSFLLQPGASWPLRFDYAAGHTCKKAADGGSSIAVPVDIVALPEAVSMPMSMRLFLRWYGVK